MIDYTNETLHLPHKSGPSPIKAYVVWWLGPIGYVFDLNAVKKQCDTLSIPIEQLHLAFKAVPIALAEDGTYEELR